MRRTPFPPSLLSIFLFLLLVLTGCRSSRHVTTDATTSASSVYPRTEDYVSGQTGSEVDKSQLSRKERKKLEREAEKKLREQQGVDSRATVSNVEAISAKLNLRLESGSSRINVGGTYRLKRNDVIQINLTYTMIITVNVGSIELTRDHILILDRLHKRYCKVSYSEVPQLAQAGVDFDYLQRIFWGEAEESPTPMLQWSYSAWTALADGQFPGQIAFTANTGKSDYKATFSLSNIRENSSWPTRIEVDSKYTPMSLNAVMKALMSVAQ